MSKATGSILIAAAPQSNSIVTLNDGLGRSYSEVEFSFETYNSVSTNNQVAVYMRVQKNPPGKSTFYLHFENASTNDASNPWQTLFSSGSTIGMQLEVMDVRGRICVIKFEDASSFGSPLTTATSNRTAYGNRVKKNGTLDYTLGTDFDYSTGADYELAYNVGIALTDAVESGDIGLELPRVFNNSTDKGTIAEKSGINNFSYQLKQLRFQSSLANYESGSGGPIAFRFAPYGNTTDWTTGSVDTAPVDVYYGSQGGDNNQAFNGAPTSNSYLDNNLTGEIDKWFYGPGHQPNDVYPPGGSFMSASSIAHTFAQIINNHPIAITASADAGLINLTASNAGTAGNQTITLTNATNLTVAGMAGGSSGDTTAPTYSAISLAANNSTVAVTFDEAVFNTNGGSGALEASDFAFSISGGSATLSSATPSSISIDGNQYTLGISLSGTPDGSETLTVQPAAADAIFDAAGNAASTSQSSNHQVTLNDQAGPTISSVAITAESGAQNNTLNEGDTVDVTVTFNEAVTVNTGGGTPSIAISVGGVSRDADYNSGTGGTSIVFRYTIASSETTDSDGISIGANAISLNSGTMRDAAGNNATLTHSAVSANSSYKVDTTKPTISSLSVADDNSTVTVTFAENVYANANGTGDLVAADFALGLSGGNAGSISLNATPSAISKTSQSVWVLTLNGTNLGSNAAGTETLTVDAANNTSIFDLAGNAHTAAASSTTLNSTTAIADSVNASLGSTAGTIKAGFNNTAPRAQLNVPAGALDSDVTLTVDTSPSSMTKEQALKLIHDAGTEGDIISDIVSLEPHGQVFNSAVTLIIDITGSLAGTTPSRLQVWKRNGDSAGDAWYRMPSNLWQSSTGSIEISTTSFSQYMAVEGTCMKRTRLNDNQLEKIVSFNKVAPAAIAMTGSATAKGSVVAGDLFVVQGTSGTSQPVSASVMKSFFFGGGSGLDLDDNDITNVGDINADRLSIDAAAQGLKIDATGADNATFEIIMNNDDADALSVKDSGGQDYLVFDSSDSGQSITFSVNPTFAGRTIADLGSVTTADINGGSIDGTTIGAASAAAGTFTTVDATTDVTVGSLIITDDQIQMTPSENDTATIAASSDGALSITTVDGSGTAADLTFTVDGQIELKAADAAGIIMEVGGADQVILTDGLFAPATDNDVDLGSSGYSFKDAHIQGTATIGTVTSTNVDGILGANTAAAATVTTLSATGDVDLGNETSDTITATGRFDSDLVPSTDGARDLGASGLEWKDLYIDGVAYVDSLQADQLGAALDANDQAITNINVDSGAIDGATIGANSAAAGTFTNLTVSGDLVVTGTTTTVDSVNLRVEDNVIEIARGDGTASGTMGTNAGAGIFISGSTTGRHISLLGATDGGRLKVSGSADVGAGFDVVTGGDYAIGGTSVLTATTLGSAVVNSSLTSLGTQGEALDMGDFAIQNVGDIDADSISIADAGQGLKIDATGANNATFEIIMEDDDADALSVKDSGGQDYLVFTTTNSAPLITFSANPTFAGRTIANLGSVTTADINGGSIDGTIIGAASAAAGTFTTLDATTDVTVGSLIITDDQIQMTPSENDTATIAAATDGALNITTVDGSGTGADLTVTVDGQIELKAADAAGIIMEVAGSDQVVLTDGLLAPATDNDVDLGSGAKSFKDAHIQGTATVGTVTATNVDGILGANTAAAATVTTLSATGDVDLGNETSDTITATGRFDSDLVPSTDGARDLGASGLEWKDLYIDGVAYVDSLQADQLGAALDANSQAITNINVDSGAIDGATIGANSAAAGTFTTLDCNDGAFAVANLDIDGASDIGAGLAATDLIMVDDGANGTNRKSAVSRIGDFLVGAEQGLHVVSGQLQIVPVEQVFYSSSSNTGAAGRMTDNLLTASLNTASLGEALGGATGSMMVFLNGMLQTLSSSAGVAADRCIYDYRVDKDNVGYIYLNDALDEDDVLVVKYLKK